MNKDINRQLAKKFRLQVKQVMQHFYSVRKRCVLSGYISEHDMKIAKKLAYVIAGGKVPLRNKSG